MIKELSVAYDDLKVNIKEAIKHPEALEQVRTNLLIFFPDIKNIKKVKIVENTDRSLFGILVFPEIDMDNILTSLANGGNTFKFNNIELIEIDSKLFTSTLSPQEIAACLIQTISSIIADSKPIEPCLQYIRYYAMRPNVNTFTVSRSNPYYNYILKFGLVDAIQKLTSMFFRTQDDVINDSIIAFMGIKNDINSAYEKLKSAGLMDSTTSNIGSPFTILEGCLRLYENILYNRIDFIHSINDSIKFTASDEQRKMLKNLKQYICRIDDSQLINVSEASLINLGRKSFHSYSDFVTEINALQYEFVDKKDVKNIIANETLQLYAYKEKLTNPKDIELIEQMINNNKIAYDEL